MQFVLHSLHSEPVTDKGLEQRIETAAGLERDIEDARRTLAQLEVDTWGVVLHETEGERFVVVPDGALADPPWWVDDRPALKLSKPPRRIRSHRPGPAAVQVLEPVMLADRAELTRGGRESDDRRRPAMLPLSCAQ